MTADELRDRISNHYATSAEPLLLSDFGKELRLAGVWPKEGDVRTLASLIRELTPEIGLLSDPDSKSYIVVVPMGMEGIAEAAFQRRRELLMLKRLPRVLLLAFCVDTENSVWLRVVPPFRYSTSQPSPESNFVIVDEDLRIPGLFVDEARGLPVGDAQRLVNNIVEWSRRHCVDLSKFVSEPPPPSLPVLAPVKQASNALERLYEAQALEWRHHLVVPVDIALTLSRMP